jgi:TolA-binding protein
MKRTRQSGTSRGPANVWGGLPWLATLFLGAWLAALGTSTVPAQEEHATRLLENGDRLERDGKLTQARAAWTEVVSSHPDSTAAPSALDRLGTAAYPVEDFALRGQIAHDALVTARQVFERVAGDYRASAEAPRAVFKLGLLFSDPSSPFFDLDEAYAKFSRITTVYPGSDFVDEGLYGMGEVLVKQGQPQRALVPISTLMTQAPDSPLADDALFLKGICLCRLENFREAIRAFQSLRDRYPDSHYRARARDRNTHLLRILQARNGDARDLYSQIHLVLPGLSSEWRIRSVISMATDAANRMAIADSRSGVIHVLDPEGTPLSRTDIKQPSAVWLGPDGLLASSRGDVIEGARRIPLIFGGDQQKVGDAAYIGRDPFSRLIVWDKKSDNVLRFGEGMAFETILSDGRQQRVDAAVVGEDGSVYLLDARERTVRVLQPGGGTRNVAIGLEALLRRPDFMAVDFLGNIYVMDTSSRAIGAFEPGGTVLAQVVSGKEDGAPFPRPLAMAVNGRGEILVYDERRDGIVVVR